MRESPGAARPAENLARLPARPPARLRVSRIRDGWLRRAGADGAAGRAGSGPLRAARAARARLPVYMYNDICVI